MSNLNDLLTKIETARLWNHFHKDWLLEMRTALRALLPVDYRIFVESEAVLISPETPDTTAKVILPDVAVTRANAITTAASASSQSSSATAAVVEAIEDCETETHYSLIVRRAPENRLVAAIELLSPSNKGIGNRLDRERHLRKRAEYLDAGISLLEIDVLRQGERDVPAVLGQLVDFDRIAWTAFHQDGRRKYRGWGWNQPDPLPRIDWQIDGTQTTIIELQHTLEAAAEFNRWEEPVG